MRGTGFVVWLTTGVAWAVSLPVVFGLVYGACFSGCLAEACPQYFHCDDAWSYAPVLFVTGLIGGLLSGLVGFEYHRYWAGPPEKPWMSPSLARAFLDALPFVLLGAIPGFLLLPGLGLAIIGKTILLAGGLTILAALLAWAARSPNPQPT